MKRHSNVTMGVVVAAALAVLVTATVYAKNGGTRLRDQKKDGSCAVSTAACAQQGGGQGVCERVRLQDGKRNSQGAGQGDCQRDQIRDRKKDGSGSACLGAGSGAGKGQGGGAGKGQGDCQRDRKKDGSCK